MSQEKLKSKLDQAKGGAMVEKLAGDILKPFLRC